MEVLKIVFSIVALLANLMVTYFAITAWFRLRDLRRDMKVLLRGVSMTAALTMARRVKENFEEVNRMRQTLRDLVDNEQFEEAERLKALIVHAEKKAQESLKKFNETHGSDFAEIVVTQVNC